MFVILGRYEDNSAITAVHITGSCKLLTEQVNYTCKMNGWKTIAELIMYPNKYFKMAGYNILFNR